MKILIMPFSPASYNFVALRSNLVSASFSNTASLCSSLGVRGQVSYTYKITDKIVVSYV
jgi:hypothetical protein